MDCPTIEIRRYNREQVACHLLRINPNKQRAPGHVRRVMTRWLKRWWRDDPGVVVGTAQVQISRDLWTERLGLRAVAPAFRNAEPEDRATLATLVDEAKFDAIEIPVFPPPGFGLGPDGAGVLTRAAKRVQIERVFHQTRED
jgi:hypothetical protein